MIKGGVGDSVTMRNASTANFLIDSIDRNDNESSADFTISKKNSLLNGFFSRLAVSEVIADWCVDNISEATENNKFSILVGASPFTVTLDDGSYTIKAALDALIVALNAGGTGLTFSLTDGAGFKELTAGSAFTVVSTNLSIQLNIKSGVSGTSFPVHCPVLLPYTYIDFVSSDLTYNQSLKDTTTNPIEQNILYRWYFAWDTPPDRDAYGYPIYQGYERFIARRALPFPKQIAWENNMPIGQLNFKVYSSQGTVLLPSQVSGEFEWKMTLLVSEN